MVIETTSTLDSLAVATFMDIGKQVDKIGDFDTAETYYLQALRAAETIYGDFHGETGMVLIRLAAFYRSYGKYENAIEIEQRIGEIAGLYLNDQCA